MKWYRYILPFLLAQVTRHSRMLVTRGVDFEWSSNSWVHDFFRCYELAFGRRTGIRCEMSASISGQQPHTFEAACSLVETLIRNRLLVFKIVRVPVLSFNNGVIFSSAYRFAIAVDAATGSKDNGGAATSLTFAHTITGSNTILIVTGGTNSVSTPSVNTVTYNAVSATEVDEQVNGSTRLAIYDLVAPTTGANNVIVTWSGAATGGGQQLNAVSVSYTGAAQSGQPDSNGFDTFTLEDPLAVTTTVVAANCWLSGAFQGSTGNIADGVAGAGTVQRAADQFNQVGADSNGTVGTGAQSLNWDPNGTDIGVSMVISIAPAGGAAAVVRPIPFFSLLGIGT